MAGLKIRCLQSKFKPILRQYKYNTFIRYWIQCYLELSIACFIQVSSAPDSETVGVANFVTGFLVTCFIVATPFVLFVFCKKYKTWIIMLSEESNFHVAWGSLFYELDYQFNFNPSLTYPMFFLRRLLFSISLTVLSAFPYIQAGVNAFLARAHCVFVLKVKPYKLKSTQIAFASVEIASIVLFTLVIYFLQNDFRGIDSLMESFIIYFVMIVFPFQTLVTICYYFSEKFCSTPETVQTNEATQLNQTHLFFERANHRKVFSETSSPPNQETQNSEMITNY